MLQKLTDIIRWIKAWHCLPVLEWLFAASEYKKKNYQKAALLYSRGLTRKPGHKAAHCARLDLAHCYYKLQKYKECEHTLLDALSFKPNSKTALLRLVRLYAWLGKHKSILQRLVVKITQGNRDEELSRYYFYSFFQLENASQIEYYPHTVNLLSSLIEEFPDSTLFRTVHQLLKIDEGQITQRQAVDSFERILDADNVELITRLLIAQFYIKLKKTYCARRVLHLSLLAGDSHPNIESLIAQTYLISGPHYSPTHALNLSLNAAQSTAWLHTKSLEVLAESYYHLGDSLAAIAVTKKALEMVQEEEELELEKKVLLQESISSYSTDNIDLL